jgi:hypothetical protein
MLEKSIILIYKIYKNKSIKMVTSPKNIKILLGELKALLKKGKQTII